MSETTAAARLRLAELGRADDRDIRPAEAALLVAGLGRPHKPVAAYLSYLAELSAEIRAAIGDGGDVERLAGALMEVFGRRHRYRGDDRDDEDVSNTNLMDVIDRRRGVADAVGLVALDAARGAGLAAEGLAFPVRFLLRLEDDCGRRAILDPCAGSAALDPPAMRALLKAGLGLEAELEPAHYAAMGNRDMVVRLQTDTKLRLLRCGRVDLALAVVEATLLLAPGETALWREAGLMHMRLDDHPGAVAALEQFVARTTNAQARARTLALLAEIKGHLT
ncbi:SirB1 family protein [Magnetospirillum sp. SS-4]|uniref:SirB1 family protein n=1 Tax=Magnetospirillum sp. SS-4 TaxID=2681465 RepID=UPI0020C55341|nr:transglutaminase-like domain-containing protein [Magnetospirillum sp. SS-4]